MRRLGSVAWPPLLSSMQSSKTKRVMSQLHTMIEAEPLPIFLPSLKDSFPFEVPK